MAQINFKVTTWEVVQVPDELVDIIKKGIENGTITSSGDLYEMPELEDVDLDLEFTDDGPDQLSVEENNGEFTIELRTSDDYELITTNLNCNK